MKAENGEAMKSSGGKCRHWGQMGSKLFPVQALPSSFFCGHLPTCMCIYLIHCNPMDYTVHGILQARTLGGLPFPSPGALPHPGIEPQSPALQADSLPSEPPGKPSGEKERNKKAFLDPTGVFVLRAPSHSSTGTYRLWGTR